jgi:hypothetical protein
MANYEEEESKKKINKFLKEYQELVKKYDVELFAAPQLAPSGERGFNIIGIVVPIDKARGGVKSPIGDTVGDVKNGDILK